MKLVTLLGFDSIPAILSPRFVTPFEAEDWMGPDEQVLGLSINEEQQAYPIRMLSRALSHLSFWFAWKDWNPDTEVHNFPSGLPEDT